MEGTRVAWDSFGEKNYGKKALVSPRSRWEYNVKMDQQEI
jgi:hypothetical protein